MDDVAKLLARTAREGSDGNADPPSDPSSTRVPAYRPRPARPHEVELLAQRAACATVRVEGATRTISTPTLRHRSQLAVPAR